MSTINCAYCNAENNLPADWALLDEEEIEYIKCVECNEVFKWFIRVEVFVDSDELDEYDDPEKFEKLRGLLDEE